MDGLTGPSVALVPWGATVEEFLDPLGLDLDAFCDAMAGGWLFGHAAALQRLGCRPRVVVVSRAVRAREERVHRATGTPVTAVPAPRLGRRPARAGLLRDLHDYRAALPPSLRQALAGSDAVLVQEYEDPRADLLARRCPVPVLASFQGGVPPWERAPLQRRLRPGTVRRLAAVLVGSGVEDARVRATYGVEPVRVVNPVDASLWQPSDRAAARARLGLPGGPLVAWHGRVELHRKGLDVLLDAWARVREARPAGHLVLAGGGADDDALATRLDPSVTWLRGYTTGGGLVREVLAACDVWVSASRSEGFAVAPLEAMACGRPVVVSDVPGSADLLPAGLGDGGLVVPREDPAALAAALLRLLADPVLRADAGRAARARVVDAFSVDAVAGQLAGALRQAGLAVPADWAR